MMRKRIAGCVLAFLAVPFLVEAQIPSASAPTRGYIEGVADSAFGNVTSQSYGAELGVTVTPDLQVFIEGGQIRNVATSDINDSAQLIAGYLSQTQSNVAFTVRQPVTFFGGGVKYLMPVPGRVRPYVLGGGGFARVKQDVTFTIGGTDITANTPQYGVTLGSDLSGSFTKPMLTFGAGVAVPLWHQLGLDLQYRFGRIFVDGGGINTSRAGVGLLFAF